MTEDGILSALRISVRSKSLYAKAEAGKIDLLHSIHDLD